MKEQFEKYKNFGMLLILLFFIVDIYYNYYNTFLSINFVHPISNSIVQVFVRTGILSNPFKIRIGILMLTVFFILFDTGKKDIDMDKSTAIQYVLVSSLLFICTGFLVYLIPYLFIYIPIMIISYAFTITSYSTAHRVLDQKILKDRYNLQNKTFPQMMELLENDMSVNIPYEFVKGYNTKKINGNKELIPVMEKGYINFVAPERATIILGKPGSGKTYSFNEEFIRQFIKKGFSMINYDFKFPTLTNIAYNYYLHYESSYDKYENKGRFAVVNLDDPRYSDRCNPIHRDLLEKQSEAIDAVYTIFFNLDKKSAQKQDFFQMSAMAITSAALWFLRNYKGGIYCSFPHLIEFIQQPDEKMLTILDSYPDLRYFTSSFTDALKKESFEQLSGQTASARIPLGKCATPEMFWVMTDPNNEGVNLRVNRKEEVTILNIANNPETQKTNAPALGLYMSQSAKLINQQNRVPCCFHVDELPTIFINGLNNLIATARSNKVCVVLSAQDYSQLVMEYGREQADTIFNTIDNIASGKVAIDTAKKISEAIGKINYQSQSITISQESTSTSFNTQRDYIVPPEDISQLSQGQFVGIVSDKYGQEIKYKAFKGIVNPSKKELGNESYQMKYPWITQKDLSENQTRIQEEINQLVEEEMNRIIEGKLVEQTKLVEEEEEAIRNKIEANLPFMDLDLEIEDDEDQGMEEIETYKKMPEKPKNGMIDKIVNDIKPIRLKTETNNQENKKNDK